MSRSGDEVLRVASVPVDVVDMDAAIACVDRFVAARTPHYNVAINAAKVVEYQHDAKLHAAIEHAHLRTPDGQSVVWAARVLGRELPERVAGADLMMRLLEHSAARGYAVYFLGAREDVVRTCVDRSLELYPSLRVAGYRNGYFDARDVDEVVAAIRAAAPDILFLGFGSPAKEYFMYERYEALGVPFVMGVGGTFDVLAGLVKRAPRWMQRTGLEWLFRVAQEPRRMWKRYLVGNTRFVLLVLRELSHQGVSRFKHD